MQIILSMGIDGICYYSKKIKYDEFALPCCINMAIPAKYNGEEKISKICKSIKIRNPVNMEEFTMVKNKYLRNSNDLHGGVLLAKFIGPYDNTIFSDFDRYLKDQPYMKFDIKDINRSKVRN
jgi:hypothetical protein